MRWRYEGYYEWAGPEDGLYVTFTVIPFNYSGVSLT